MKEKFPIEASVVKSDKIYELIHGEPRDFNKVPYVHFKFNDIFNCLPHSITFDGKRGDLCVTPHDISYFSIAGEWLHQLVYYESIPIDGDIYDAVINMIKWLKKNKLM